MTTQNSNRSIIFQGRSECNSPVTPSVRRVRAQERLAREIDLYRSRGRSRLGRAETPVRPPTCQQIWIDQCLDLKLATLSWEINARGGNDPIAEFYRDVARIFYARYQRARSEDARQRAWQAIGRGLSWLAQVRQGDGRRYL